MTNVRGGDAVTPSNLPRGLDFYWGYGNGRYADFLEIMHEMQPTTVEEVEVWLNNAGNILDCERGDAAATDIGQYIQWRLAAGIWRPGGYGSAMDYIPAMRNTLDRLGISRPSYRLISAHYTNTPHICGPTTCGIRIDVDDTQWTDHNNLWDEHLALPSFLRSYGPIYTPTPPGKPNIIGGIVSSDGKGYAMAATDGGVFTFGDEHFDGSMGGKALAQPIVAIMADPSDGDGYVLIGADGGVFAFHANYEGSTADIKLKRPIVGGTMTPDGKGYWLCASDGGVFSFGDAKFHGSTGGVALNKPVVGMARHPSGDGYWLVAADGGVFAFGKAGAHGSLGNVKLNQPIVGMSPTSTGNGYWLTAADGGVFAFGDARFYGSTGSIKLAKPIVGIMAAPHDTGYGLVAQDGGVFCFGSFGYYGSRA